ncbi:hypothetical protein F7Q99_15675 [Streptomyces kaniharaensis]|uniref:Uncharacterized protein n=1 Tax=Streptomyces kaniharaensis TaxID=212423 RepID=A0A6N7KQ21_9ACTN|nr:hypothetical protein [Streptomyces kaniharaensis]MQS13672.1 hypothetical protein [Streptomyces kaniharaensis]
MAVLSGGGPDIFAPLVRSSRTIPERNPLQDQVAAGLVGLLLDSIQVLVPLVGAVVAAVAIRRRGRNARLALAGCLVMLPGPIVSVLVPALGWETIIRVFGPFMANNVLSAIALPFHLVGFGLLLAGALAAPTPQTPAAASQPVEDTAATV